MGGRNGLKYGNRKTEVDGIVFDSKHEAERYCELKLMEKAGYISNLELQKTFVLFGSQKDEHGKVIEQPIKYVADFVYLDGNGRRVVEDAKSEATKTAVYRIKRKLMLGIYGIRIKEV